MAGLVGGPGVEPPDAGEFAIICKKLLKKIAKIHYFSLFIKKISNYALNFCACGRKTQLIGKILKKVQLKNCIFIYFWGICW